MAKKEARSGASSRHLVLLDMDSTFIQDEVIDLLAAHAGVGAEVRAITERSMRGDLDFSSSLSERVALLKGLSTSVFEEIRSEIQLSTGSIKMVNELHSRGDKVAIISGGFENVIAPILQNIGVDFYRANILEIKGVQLTGKTLPPVIDRKAKADYLRELALNLAIPLSQTVAVGDGANDLGMMEIAGLSIAFNAKPIVQEAAKAKITSGDLYEVVTLMDNFFAEGNF